MFPTGLFAQTRVPINYWTNGFDERYGENSVIARAMNLLHDRFRSLEVLKKAYEYSRGSYHIKGGYWEECRMNRQSHFGYADLLWHQITTLARSVPFPDVEINAYHREDDSWGRADVGRVKVYWAGYGIDWSGKFKVELNRYHLGSAGAGSNPEMWASTIAHEMLHNLGHDHPPCDNGMGLQINAFSRAVHTYGRQNWAMLTFRGCR